MARGESQYLRIFSGDSTLHRWQNYYGGSVVSVDDELWSYMDFDADGLTDGDAGDEGGIRLTLPATDYVVAAVSDALRNAHLAEIKVYEFDAFLGDDAPRSDQVEIASYIGEIVSAGGPFESVNVELGSALSPVGAQIPPRKFTSRLVGVPCKL
jgi:hypothetical protein